jgi:hypothetical protein
LYGTRDKPRQHGATTRAARKAFNKIERLDRRLEKLESQLDGYGYSP